ncbi:MAG TPA: murein L,D-transpeptidase catalytic domain family protein [Flavipsychrobacter sp.]|nr:murein L,D-transpeptidase catalytic domain family protein [Flavipsychrobacter sp.]
MKKMILCVSVGTFLGLTIKIATAKEPTTNPSIAVNNMNDINSYISEVYSQIDFKGSEKISFDAFATAYRGYLNLRNAGKLNANKQILSVADFTLSSTKHRLWIIDLARKEVLMNDYVAHGQGSGDEFAKAFSNTENSHQSSIGFYVTDDTYVGKHGTSLRLHGMDNGYNSAAYQRAIVVHGADYVSPSFIAGQGRLGRSWGCPAVSRQSIGKVIDYIKGGTCLFIYVPQKQYLAGSSWLNKKIERLPEDYMIKDMFLPSTSKSEVRYVYADNAQDLNPASPFYITPEERAKRETLLAMNLDFIEKVLP